MLNIYVDADGCPVKEEVYRVARRCALFVYVVANSYIQLPRGLHAELVMVGRGEGVADDWIAAHAGPGDIVVTADLPLAARCIEAGARVIHPKGREHTSESIGNALAGRALTQHLLEIGVTPGGPAPMGQKDRSRFLNNLDALVQAVLRSHRG
ncbi:MAG: YaiI/YqxD family protein [Deltaproteobacteria bacterium]|nr:YaiI/YqxD family protein [Deltaproteobacteria bacterium]